MIPILNPGYTLLEPLDGKNDQFSLYTYYTVSNRIRVDFVAPSSAYACKKGDHGYLPL